MTHEVIDVHGHLIPDFYNAAMVRAGLTDKKGRVVIDGFPHPHWDIDDTLRMMDAHHVRATAMSISAPGVEFAKIDEAKSLARDVNQLLSEIVAGHPARFASLAVLPLSDIDASLAETEVALGKLKCDGITLYSNIGGRYLGDPYFAPLLEELHRRGTTVFVHPVCPQGFNAIGMGLPAPLIEYPFESTRTVVSLLRSGALEKYSGIKLIIPHGGGTIPFLAARIARTMSTGLLGNAKMETKAAMALLQSIHFDLTAMNSHGNLALLREFVPAEQLLVGYDYPFRTEDTIDVQAAINEGAGFSDGDIRKLRTENALRLFPRLKSAAG